MYSGNETQVFSVDVFSTTQTSPKSHHFTSFVMEKCIFKMVYESFDYELNVLGKIDNLAELNLFFKKTIANVFLEFYFLILLY